MPTASTPTSQRQDGAGTRPGNSPCWGPALQGCPRPVLGEVTPLPCEALLVPLLFSITQNWKGRVCFQRPLTPPRFSPIYSHRPIPSTCYLGSQQWTFNNPPQTARAALTKHLGWGGLNNRNLFPPSSGGWKSEIKMPAGLVSAEASILGLQQPTSPVSSQGPSPVHTHPGVSLWLQTPRASRKPGLIRAQPNICTELSPLTTLSPNIVTFRGPEGWDFNTWIG